MGGGPTAGGLCDTCRHARGIVSGKGSIFLMCELSKTDPRFRKYPPLPVMRCPGWAAIEAAAAETDDSA